MLSGVSTIDELFKNTVGQHSDKTALIFQEQKYTFAELDDLVEKLASFLFNEGVRKQEKAIIYLPHMPQWVAIWLASQRIGAIAIPVTHFYGEDELGYIAADSGAETIFCADTNLAQVRKVAGNHPFKKIVVVKRDPSGPEPVEEKGEGLFSFESIAQGNFPSLPHIDLNGNDIAEFLYTGGTTGLPKGVPIPNILFLEAITVKRDEIEPLIPRGKGITLQGAPLNHIMGQELGFGSLLNGDTLILLAKMDLESIFFNIEKHQVNIFFGTPTLCRMILEHNSLDNYKLDSLIYVFTAGEALPPEIARKWKNKFGKPLYHGYGATETCGGITGVSTVIPFPDGTLGKVVPTKKIKIVNPDTLEPVATNEPGEVLVSSENMVASYWNKPEETAIHFVELEGRLWYRTGDIARMDEEGWLFFVDRSADLIKHKGYRVAATKVESILYRHDSISECCVVGVPDPNVGEKVKARIILREGSSTPNAEELIKWCSEGLASYEIPGEIEFCNELPKSPVGKILRRIVRDEERQKVQSGDQAG